MGVRWPFRGRAWRRWGFAAGALLVLIAWTGCVSPERRFAARAAEMGLQADLVQGTVFHHVVFRQRGQRPSSVLHVYIDGDGTPWLHGRPASDPTPRNALVLALMALDPNPAIYLGRPCYHGLSETPPCSSALWTRERYSEAVVSSMAAALRRILATEDFHHVAWFGHSGGGTLAVLLAPRFPQTASVVTVAANLDIDAWADLHGYDRLPGSLNPATHPPLPPSIRQHHYVGSNDRVVPKEVVERGPIDPDALIVLPTYDHTCCWAAIWPAVLDDIQR